MARPSGVSGRSPAHAWRTWAPSSAGMRRIAFSTATSSIAQSTCASYSVVAPMSPGLIRMAPCSLRQ